MIYNEICRWRKNLFMVPRGKAGSNFIIELTRLLYLFIDNTKWSRVSLALVNIFIPLMLQKPSSKSKAKENAQYLQSRLQHWNQGDLQSLLAENREIQKRLKQRNEKKMKLRISHSVNLCYWESNEIHQQ